MTIVGGPSEDARLLPEGSVAGGRYTEEEEEEEEEGEAGWEFGGGVWQ